jgi:tetratricopeptide (TPR) repeat protein
VATALAGTRTYTRHDIDRLLTRHGRYVIEDAADDHAVYRLYHRELADRLRPDAPGPDATAEAPTAAGGPAMAVLTALAAVARAAEPDQVPAYLRRHLADHADVLGEATIPTLRDLAAVTGWARAPLAASLNTLAPRLSNVGRREDALTASQEAVTLRRDLTATFTPHLATSLHTLAIRLSDIGRRDVAENAWRDAEDALPDQAAKALLRVERAAREARINPVAAAARLAPLTDPTTTPPPLAARSRALLRQVRALAPDASSASGRTASPTGSASRTRTSSESSSGSTARRGTTPGTTWSPTPSSPQAPPPPCSTTSASPRRSPVPLTATATCWPPSSARASTPPTGCRCWARPSGPGWPRPHGRSPAATSTGTPTGCSPRTSPGSWPTPCPASTGIRALRLHLALLTLAIDVGTERAHACLADRAVLDDLVHDAAAAGNPARLTALARLEAIGRGAALSGAVHELTARILGGDPDGPGPAGDPGLSDLVAEADPTERNRLLAEIAALQRRRPDRAAALARLLAALLASD